jgi:heme/copper-type cytochrome/quinol oxidase subunit 2
MDSTYQENIDTYIENQEINNIEESQQNNTYMYIVLGIILFVIFALIVIVLKNKFIKNKVSPMR